jgi:hypothetical protein
MKHQLSPSTQATGNSRNRYGRELRRWGVPATLQRTYATAF